MKAKKIVTLLVAAALTCGVVGSTTSVYAADVTLKLAHADAEGTIFDQGAVAFQEKLQELSGGTMDVELYRNGTLGSLSEVAEGIQMGTVDVAPIVTTTLANFASELNAFDMPYLIIVFNLAVGQATPPFGNCLFAAIPATKQDVVTLAKNVFPFVIILFATVFLVSYVPAFSTFLPNLMKG